MAPMPREPAPSRLGFPTSRRGALGRLPTTTCSPPAPTSSLPPCCRRTARVSSRCRRPPGTGAGLVVAGGAGGAAVGPAAGDALDAAVRARPRGPHRHRLRRGGRRLRGPAAARRVDHPRHPAGVRRDPTPSDGRTRSRPGATASSSEACTASRSVGCSRGSRCSTAPATRRRSPSSGLVQLLGRRARSEAPDRRPVADASPGLAGACWGCRAQEYLTRLGPAVDVPLPEPWSGEAGLVGVLRQIPPRGILVGVDQESETLMHTTQHRDAASGIGVNAMALSATLHCLTGCAIGEILGLVIGTAVGLSTGWTIVLAVSLAFLFGYMLSTLPLLRAGLGLGSALAVVLAADTLSIATMELVDNLVMAAHPGGDGRRPGQPHLLDRHDDRADGGLLRRLPGQPPPAAARQGPRPDPRLPRVRARSPGPAASSRISRPRPWSPRSRPSCSADWWSRPPTSSVVGGAAHAAGCRSRRS